MQYVGSKGRFARQILSIVLEDRKQGQLYVEPFVGACNMIDKVTGRRIGSDAHYYLIQMLLAVQSGWLPPTSITEQQYTSIRNDKLLWSRNPALVGFVGFGCSFGGKWFGGYARNNKQTNYCFQSRKTLLNQFLALQDVAFKYGDYEYLKIEEPAIIYCDIPYFETTEYKIKFDHNRFWKWADTQIKLGHKVFVSEYQAPKDWQCVWEQETLSLLSKDQRSTIKTEKLFTK